MKWLNNLEIKMYEKGNETDIIELFELVFKKKISREFWNWRFINNPWAKGIIFLAWDNSTLAAHYAVMPIQLDVSNNFIQSVFSMTTMTHPNYRGRSLFPKLAKITYEEARKKGFNLVYGFPNINSHQTFIKKLNWADFGNIPLYKMKLENILEKSSYDQKNLKAEQIQFFDEKINEFWEKAKNNFVIKVPRTKEFLNWRFKDNPETKYFMFLLKDGNNSVIGYFVLKIYESNNDIMGHIVDYCLLDYDQFNCVLLYASEFFEKHKVKELSFWMNRRIFIKLSNKWNKFYQEESMKTTFIGYSLFKKFKNSQLLKNLDNYYITMADSDVF